MSTVAEIEHAVRALPDGEREELFSKIKELIEDFLDLQEIQQAQAEGGYRDWTDYKRERHARHN